MSQSDAHKNRDSSLNSQRLTLGDIFDALRSERERDIFLQIPFETQDKLIDMKPSERTRALDAHAKAHSIPLGRKSSPLDAAILRALQGGAKESVEAQIKNIISDPNAARDALDEASAALGVMQVDRATYEQVKTRLAAPIQKTAATQKAWREYQTALPKDAGWSAQQLMQNRKLLGQAGKAGRALEKAARNVMRAETTLSDFQQKLVVDELKYEIYRDVSIQLGFEDEDDKPKSRQKS